jgi:hypothetical protein
MVEDIIKYESGEMTFEEVVHFFQGLLDAGLVWKLQGHYCRTAKDLLENGYCFERRILQ